MLTPSDIPSKTYNKNIIELVQLYTPTKIHIIKNILIFRFIHNLFSNLSKFDEKLGLKPFIDKNAKKFRKIKINHASFRTNYDSLNKDLDNIQKEYNIFFNDDTKIKDLFSFYKFWYIYLKDGDLDNFYSIIDEEFTTTYSDNDTYDSIFLAFRRFYNSLNGHTIEEVEGGKRITGGAFNFLTLILPLLLLFFISPLAFAPGNEQYKNKTIQTSGITTVVTGINLALNYGIIEEKTSITPFIRNTINKYHVNDSQFDMFLDGAEYLINTIITLSKYNKRVQQHPIIKTIAASKNDIDMGRTLMTLGQIIDGIATLIHEATYDPTIYDRNSDIVDVASNINRFTKQQLDDLKYLGQLTPDELNKLPLKNTLEDLLYEGMIDGGKKRKTRRKIKRKTKRRKTKRRK